jgi:hypothetical protein
MENKYTHKEGKSYYRYNTVYQYMYKQAYCSTVYAQYVKIGHFVHAQPSLSLLSLRLTQQ